MSDQPTVPAGPTDRDIWQCIAVALLAGFAATPLSVEVGPASVWLTLDTPEALAAWAEWAGLDNARLKVNVTNAGGVVQREHQVTGRWSGRIMRLLCQQTVPVESVSPQLTPGGDR